MSFCITGVELVGRSLPGVRAKKVGGPEEDVAKNENAEYEEYMAKMAKFDCDSVCFSEDSEVSDVGGSSPEEPVGESDRESGEDVPVRKARGADVYCSNGYFSFTDNPLFRDVKVSVAPKWCTLEHLGASSMSKAVLPANFDEPRASPVRSFLVLRAWMLFKARTNEFRDRRSSRRRLFAGETRDLRQRIVALSSSAAPSTGHPAADALIRGWAPEVLIPGS